MSADKLPIQLPLPQDVRCAVALSYDLEMCSGYAPDGVNHGRIISPVQDYTLRLCETAETYGTRLHFFYVCNGLEEPDISYVQEIIRRGHVIDSHTYSHQGVALVDEHTLDNELRRANQLLGDRLGVTSTVLRGPYGYREGWKVLPPANRQVIMKNGFRWISGEFADDVYDRDWEYWVGAPGRHLPYAYPEGLIEIPAQGWTDRMWFDLRPQVDQAVVDDWRQTCGHRPVPEGWVAPWTDKSALDDWVSLNLACLDYAYENRLLWVPVWHPYTHYLHDPENRMLEALLQHATDKSERVWICTLRDAAAMLEPGIDSLCDR